MLYKQKWVIVALVLFVLGAGLSVYAQATRPYRNGSVWDIGFIRMKPGMESAYLNYVAGEWKKEQDALKKEGLMVSPDRLRTEPAQSG